ncbi:MAG: hypothetical protein KVP17_002127 [Porospora cf. gigantea B]|uniref:uncharacterized protein n=1 Tax=Porospora cf. gigantea B TaxID=2853592 RepID=UPI003571F954|nr:MAG: hypothetical protein KVP17_002127 [Porospora cf. gigantea B]
MVLFIGFFLPLAAFAGCTAFPAQASSIDWCEDTSESEKTCHLTVNAAYFLDFPSGTVCFVLKDNETEHVSDYTLGIDGVSCELETSYLYDAWDFTPHATHQMHQVDMVPLDDGWRWNDEEEPKLDFSRYYWRDSRAREAFQSVDEQLEIFKGNNADSVVPCSKIGGDDYWFNQSWNKCMMKDPQCWRGKKCDCAMARRMYVTTGSAADDRAAVYEVGAYTCRLRVHVRDPESTDSVVLELVPGVTVEQYGLKLTASGLVAAGGAGWNDEGKYLIRYRSKLWRAEANPRDVVDSWDRVGALQVINTRAHEEDDFVKAAATNNGRIDWTKWKRSFGKDYHASASISSPQYDMHGIITRVGRDITGTREKPVVFNDAGWWTPDSKTLYMSPNRIAGTLHVESLGDVEITMSKDAVCPEIVSVTAAGEYKSTTGADAIVELRATCSGGTVVLNVEGDDVTSFPTVVEVAGSGTTKGTVHFSSSVAKPKLTVTAKAWDDSTSVVVVVELDENSYDPSDDTDDGELTGAIDDNHGDDGHNWWSGFTHMFSAFWSWIVHYLWFPLILSLVAAGAVGVFILLRRYNLLPKKRKHAHKDEESEKRPE